MRCAARTLDAAAMRWRHGGNRSIDELEANVEGFSTSTSAPVLFRPQWVLLSEGVGSSSSPLSSRFLKNEKKVCWTRTA